MARSRAAAKPNIVVIWGDDIGITNLSCYSDGLMGYRTPNIDRIAQEGMRVHRLLRRAELHGRTIVVHHRSARIAHRVDQSRSAGRHRWSAQGRPDHRRAAQAAWAMRPRRSARTTSATATNICRPCTASTSSTAICIT